MSTPRPLDGVRVLELGQLLAGPFAGTLMAYFGAEVVKVEPLEGDPIRTWRGVDGDTSVWWQSLSRNKLCIALDLKSDEGRDIARGLAGSSDVLIENFRPGTMERWGLGPDELLRDNERLIYARVSGFGQTGPYRERAGFASVCEAAAGLRHLIGEPGAVPLRANLSLGDSLGGLSAILGVLLALLHRERTGRGQVVDVALTEAIFNVMESVLPEYEQLGVSRAPSGATITGIVPSNVYPTESGERVVIGANTDGLFAALMRVIGRADLARDPELSSNRGRVARAAEIDAAIGAWTEARPLGEAVALLTQAGVPVSAIQDAAAVLSDPHFQTRGIMEAAPSGDRQVRVPALFPKLADTPGRTEWAGPTLGAHTDRVLSERLSLDAVALGALRQRRVIR